jgi:hypothetical protein
MWPGCWVRGGRTSRLAAVASPYGTASATRSVTTSAVKTATAVAAGSPVEGALPRGCDCCIASTLALVHPSKPHGWQHFRAVISILPSDRTTAGPADSSDGASLRGGKSVRQDGVERIDGIDQARGLAALAPACRACAFAACARACLSDFPSLMPPMPETTLCPRAA